jgi:aminopeptidase N
MDLYFERHDGEATTIEAFLKVFEDATGTDLGQFSRWYLNAGTPAVTASDSYDAASQTYTLTLSQKTAPTPGQPDKPPFVIPVKFGLIGPNGSPMGWSGVTGGTVQDDLIVLDGDSVTLTFTGVANRPVPSLFRGFSAPIKLATNLTQQDLLFLARHDSDPFNRWDALQTVSTQLMAAAATGRQPEGADVDALRQAIIDTLEDPALDHAFKAQVIAMPDETVIARQIGKDVDPGAVAATRAALIRAIVGPIVDRLAALHAELTLNEPYSPDAAQAGRRSLRNGLLSLLTAGSDRGASLAEAQYQAAGNMTDRYAALAISAQNWTPDDGVIERLRAILAAPDFPRTNPNRLRALLGSFVMTNPAQFARGDGLGFRFVAEAAAEIDKVNPQVAARILTGFRILPLLEAGRREAGRNALEALKNQHTLSRNTGDIVDRILAG